MTRLAVIAIVFSNGCYAYMPQASTSTPAGREFQLSLSDSGSVVLSPVVGPAADAINGRIVSQTNDVFVVAVTSVHQRDGQETRWRGERIDVSKRLVNRADERQFSPTRTGLFTGIAAAAFVAARQAFAGRGVGGGGAGTGQSGGHR